MSEPIKIEKVGPARWVVLDDVAMDDSLTDRCTVVTLQSALDGFGDMEVVSATVNRTGQFQPPAANMEDLPGIVLPDPEPLMDLPDFCDVQVHQRGADGQVVEFFVWVPLGWNGRFLGTTGGGSRTMHWTDMPWVPGVGLAPALRNGFATAATDAGNRDPRYVDWALRADTGELDWELVRNWAYRSTHDMTLVGKAITEALHGRAPRYSYLQGCSGGGRQALESAQRYPEDYDGIWAAVPAINWTRTIPAGLWPALVMKERGNVLPRAKLEAFRAAAVEACDGIDGLRDGIVGAFDPCEFDPRKLVGEETDAGPITDADAEVVAEIWQGPRRADGSFLWYGLRPTIASWTPAQGWSGTIEVDGELEPLPLFFGPAHFRWVLRDPTFDWKTLTFERFEELFDQGVRDLAEIASDDPNLAPLRAAGAKLLITQGADDEVLPFQGVVDYYRRVIEAIGGEEDTASFARLFVTDGDGHAMCIGAGPGVTVASGMAALMDWVEHGDPPDVIVGERVDPITLAVTATRPVYPYPMVARGQGTGDPDDWTSYAAHRPDAAGR
jgi:hypothetical protein